MTWPNYSPACRKAVNDLLKRGGSLSAYRANPLFPSWTGPLEGSYAALLEREIEKRFAVKHCIAVNSGTAALHCGLRALDLRGAEVVTSPYTFSATVSAILLAGGTPVFADVDPYSFCIGVPEVKRVITRRTKAILPVSLFGGMSDVRGLKEFGLPVVEDACQAVGASSGGKYSGTVADMGCYSFNGGKNVPAGEAGALVTNDDHAAEAARLFMNHGENFNRKDIGVNYRLNEITACVAYHGLLELEERNQRRRDLADALFEGLMRCDWKPRHKHMLAFQWNARDEKESHVFYVNPFTLHGMDRPLFIKRMKRQGIPVGAGYITPPLHKYKAFRKYARGPLPVVEELSSKTLCILSTLTPDRPLSYAEHVAKCMRRALK